MDFLFQRLREAILETQKNVKFQPVEDTPNGNSITLKTVVFSFRSIDYFVVVFARNCSKLAMKYKNWF